MNRRTDPCPSCGEGSSTFCASCGHGAGWRGIAAGLVLVIGSTVTQAGPVSQITFESRPSALVSVASCARPGVLDVIECAIGGSR